MLAPTPDPPPAWWTFERVCQTLIRPTHGTAVILTKHGEIVVNPGLATYATPTGSLMKLVTARAAAAENCAQLSRIRTCEGRLRWRTPDGRVNTYTCWETRGHGDLNLSAALSRSCNIYFFSLGRDLAPGRLKKYGEAAGFETADAHTWDSPLSAVGDRKDVKMTPRHAAHWMQTLARGQALEPHCPSGFEQLRSGLRGAVLNGTAKAAATKGLWVAGKTGTGLYADGSNRTWGWFTGWAFHQQQPAQTVVMALRLPDAAGPGKAAATAGALLRAWQGLGCP
jgi:cell division protein FtsI/penicillin-binding protein 2